MILTIDGCFGKKSSEKSSNFPNNPWFNNDCKTQKRIVNDYKHHNYIDIEPYKSQFKGIKQNYHRITQQNPDVINLILEGN